MTDRANDISISVRRIKEFSFQINEALYVENEIKNKDQDQILKIETDIKLSFTIETNLVFLVVRVYYHSSEPNVIGIYSDITVQNVFEVSDLKQFQVSSTEIKFPPHIITSLVGLSISHTRALLAKNISGTLMQENIMAIIDPSLVAKYFFPKMFEIVEPISVQEIIDKAE